MTNQQTLEDLIFSIKQRQSLEKQQQETGWCCWLLSQHPFFVLSLCVFVVAMFSAVAFVFTDQPDFGDPAKGFEVRGNDLANKLVTWHNLLNQTGYALMLSNYPYDYFKKKTKAVQVLEKKRLVHRSVNAEHRDKFGNYFCNNPRSNYASWSFTLESFTLMSLWSTDAMLSMCKVEEDIQKSKFFSNVCLRNSSMVCCRIMSLPNYVAFLAGLNSCLDLTNDRLSSVHSILVHCAKFYCDKRLKSNCWNSHQSCSNVPMQCQYYNVVYSIFHYFLDKNVLCPFSSNSTHFVAAFLPAFKYTNGLIPLYYEKFDYHFTNGIKIYSIDFGIKNKIFEDFLFANTVYPFCAMLGVGLILLLYTGSLFVTIMNWILSISAMLSAYFFYKVLFNFTFFPFMNLAAIVVVIGISADCLLIFFGAWRSAIKSYSACDHLSPVNLITKVTMEQVTWSIFVTSSTTAAAFFASYSSEVTAIKCFGIYTGFAVLSSFVLWVTWLPASVVIHHRHFSNMFPKCRSLWLNLLLLKFYMKLCQITAHCARVFFDQIQVLIIVRLRYFWIIFCFMVALGGLFVVLVYPTFHLPSSQSYFHYFQPSHPLETSLHRKFSFQNDMQSVFVIHFVFGIWPHDSGDIRNPFNTGNLHFHSHFNMSSQQSQIFLYNFCKSMTKFVYYSEPPLEIFMNQSSTNCFIESFKAWMDSRSCGKNDPCCFRQFPYQPGIFEFCLKEAMHHLSLAPGLHLRRDSPGPRFNGNDEIRAVIVSLYTNISHSASFEEVRELYRMSKQFFQPVLNRAPLSMSGGWLVSDFDFFALQQGLYDGSIASVCWSLLVGLVIFLVSTRNIVISCFATITIACIILVTTGSLVLLGWELNILESVTVSIAVGLSVDFTAHYAIAYLQSDHCHDRKQQVEEAISHVCPAIALAALTTFIAGAAMLPSTVLIYHKVGVFLMVLMTASWLYSTYFFLPLLAVCGPQKNCWKISCRHTHDTGDRGVMMTETSTCSPSTSCRHELVERSTVV